MDIDVFAPRELPTVFGVLRTALNPFGPLEAAEKAFLDTYGVITRNEPLGFDPEPMAVADVHISTPHRRKRLLQLAAVATLLHRPLRPESVAFVRALSRHLAIHDPVIDVLDALLKGQRLKVRLLTMRRIMRCMAKEAYLREGWRGIVRMFAAMALRAPINRDKLWGYKRLGLLPDGTLGREYWKHMTTVGFGFPGDFAGIPDSIAYHDVAHVLAGHDITPLGEIQQGSFQGGNRREDGFFFIQFVILQFHQGVKVTPATEAAVGNFDPVRVLWAIHRGARCNVDLTHQWDFWPLMAMPIDEARRHVDLLPAIA